MIVSRHIRLVVIGSTFATASAISACDETLTTPDLPLVANADRGNGAQCYVIGDVSSNDPSKAEGSKKNPYGSLSDVQADLRCKNIEVVYSAVALNGGITLRKGQKLRGNAGPGGVLPMISNSTQTTNDGRGVVLADKTTVSRVHVTNTTASGIYGVDVHGVQVWDNELSDFNTELNVHPSYLVIGNFQMYYGGIHVDGTGGRTMLKLSIRDNYIHDAETGGISVLSLGRARMKVDMRGNVLRLLGQHPLNPVWGEPAPPAPYDGWALDNVGINIFALDQSRMDLRLDDTLIEDHGPAAGTNNFNQIEFDGISMFAGGSAALDAVIDNYTYRISENTSPPSHGGNFRSSPLQAGVDAEAMGADFSLTIKNSHLSDPIGSPLALTSFYGMKDVSVQYILTNNVMEGPRAPFLPVVTVQHGGFTTAGVPSVGTTLKLRLENNELRRTGGFAGGLQYVNFAGGISNLKMLIEGNLITGMGSAGRGLEFTDSETTLASAIDAGGGILGSEGGNSIEGFGVDIEANNYDVSAKNNWWGTGLPPTVSGTGSVDYVPFLLVNPFP